MNLKRNHKLKLKISQITLLINLITMLINILKRLLKKNVTLYGNHFLSKKLSISQFLMSLANLYIRISKKKVILKIYETIQISFFSINQTFET